MKQILTALFLFFTFLSVYAQQTVGLFTQNPGSLVGYVLFAPIRSHKSHCQTMLAEVVPTGCISSNFALHKEVPKIVGFLPAAIA